jgi:plastin-1
MMLTLTASIMYWHLKRPTIDTQSRQLDCETASLSESTSNLSSDDSASDLSADDNGI